MARVCVLIDGGHVRALARQARLTYGPDIIERIAHACVEHEESLLRILYYDCAPYSGKVRLPVSGDEHEFKGSDAWLKTLARKNLFAIRLSVLKFRGFNRVRKNSFPLPFYRHPRAGGGPC